MLRYPVWRVYVVGFQGATAFGTHVEVMADSQDEAQVKGLAIIRQHYAAKLPAAVWELSHVHRLAGGWRSPPAS